VNRKTTRFPTGKSGAQKQENQARPAQFQSPFFKGIYKDNIMDEAVSKFSPITIRVKRNIRQLRLQYGYSMNEAASLLGVSRKQLEDIETVRNYGCHLDLELLAKVKVIYGVSLDEVFGELPSDYYSDFYIRPRKQLKAEE
jgi:DNA-binding XRE family transcriptional regulator